MPIIPNGATGQPDPEPGPASSQRSDWVWLSLVLSFLLLITLWSKFSRFDGLVVFAVAGFLFLWSIIPQRAFHVLVSAICLVGLLVAILEPTDRPGRVPNESWGVSNLRTVNTAEVTYLSSSGGRYGTIEDLIAARLLDDTFNGTKGGYRFTITLGASGYTAEAVPAPASERRWRFFSKPPNPHRYAYYSVPDAVVRYSTNASFAPPGQTGRSVQ